MLIFIFYCFITMSATSRTEDRNEAGTCSSTKDEKKGTEVKKRTFPRKGNSKGQIDKEPKEVQNESENNSSKSKYGRTENKITVLQNHNNNSNDKNRAKQKKQKKRKDKKETSHRENDTAQLPFRQVPAEVNKLEAEKFIEDLRKLEEDGVYPLKKKSMRFSRAKFFCRLCEYHCDTLTISQKHILENRHSTLKETKLLERTLHALLPPLQAQYEALTEVVENIFAEVGITDEEIEQRFEIKAELEQELQEIVKDGTLNVTGSTLSRFALRSSNLDLDVESPGTKVSAGILAIKKIIDTKNDKYIDPVNDLSSSYPCLSFTHKKHGVRVVVGIYSPTSRHLNRMLGYYSFIDRRVKVLVTAFKHWAKICKIDNHREGSLAAHCFPLMVVHFLQQVSPPVVPVLHELFEERDPEYLLTPDDLSLWKSQNVQSVGELWLNLVKFYALDFKTSINVINIRCTEPFVRKESKWGKKMAIEDPFQPKRNQTYTVSCYLVFEYITNAIRNTYRYFAIPQMSYGPLFKQMEDTCGPLYKAISGNRYNSEDDIEKSWWNIDALADDEDEEEQEEDMGVEFLDEDEEYVERIGTSISKSDLTDDVINLEESINHMAISTEVSEEGTNEASALPLENAQKKPSRTFNIGELKGTLKTILKEEAVSLLAQIEKDMLNYSFQINFTGGKKLPLFCTSCQQNGHTKYSCVDDELPPLKPLPHLRRSYLETLSHLFYQLKNECAPKPEEIRHRDFIVSELQRYIQEFFPKAVLKLFGSSANGFGFGNSDLDICFTFTDRPTGEDIDHITIIEEIAKRLKRFRECRNVLAITTAKVPIVKFFLYRAQLEADLSLYNTLALQNTQLLSTYTEIDHRVKILGYTLKYFAKLCDIGDASRGSLSSYAYILMVLHFLQQCKPAVIPVLQELYDHSKTQPEHVIDGWNAWFYDDVETLSKVWKDYGKNREGVGDLWVKLLRYYTEEFNWKDNVISIRQIEPLSKLEKLWTTKCIAIEDPFDLSHNLGTGLSRKMNAYIMTSFIKGREVFGFGLERPPHGYPSIGAYLFDKRLLTDGAPPNDRGCRWCGRIGHIVKECPRKQQQKDKQRGSKDTAKKNNEKPRTHNEDKAIPIPVPAPTTEATPGKPSKTSSVQNSREKDHSHNKSVQNTKDVTAGGHGLESLVVENSNCKSNRITRKGDINLESPSRGLPSSNSSAPPRLNPTPSQGAVSNREVTEISPTMLFQLASRVTGCNLRLPATPPIPVPPPGFPAGIRGLSSPLIPKGPFSLSPQQPPADLSRLFPGHDYGKMQQLWQSQMSHQQVQIPHQAKLLPQQQSIPNQQPQMPHQHPQRHHQQPQIPHQQPHIPQQHSQMSQQLPQMPHQQSQTSQSPISAQQSQLSKQQSQLPHQQPQITQQIQHTQMQQFQKQQQQQLYAQQQQQQQASLQQQKMHFQQPQQQMQPMNLQPQSKPQTQPPSMPFDGNAFISHVMAHASQGATVPSIPPMIRQNWGLPYTHQPPGLTLNQGHSNYSPPIQHNTNPRTSMNRQSASEGQQGTSYPLDIKETLRDSPDILSLSDDSHSPSEASSFLNQMVGSSKQRVHHSAGPHSSSPRQIFTGPALSVPLPKMAGNGETDTS